MSKGIYIDLKRMMIHDGPGIRSTLFLKGCSLRCLWCHNPESISLKPELGFFPENCTACGNCAAICKQHKFENEVHVFDRENCISCGKCADFCISHALELYGREITPEKMAELILKDRIFYENTNGGVTLSGGEPLLQSQFCRELLAILKAENIHTAIDTCGHVPWSAFEAVLPYVDMFLYDVKHIDSKKHKSCTGCGNELILENLKRLDNTEKTIEIRMPIAPGLNDSEAAITGAASFLAGLKNISGVRPLPYHGYAQNKYIILGKSYRLNNIRAPSEDKINQVKNILANQHLKILS